MIESVSEQKFDKLIDKSIKLGLCKRCGDTGDIIIRLPLFGRTGASVKCRYCGYETKLYGINYHMMDDNRFGTPVIDKSLILGIKRAIAEWNNKVGDKDNE